MDHAEYLPLFLAECRENLDEMTLAFVKLEADPADRDTIDAVFRVAHSLKGMSATMGYQAMAKLTHQMEDVLELMRRRDAALSANTIDTLLDCLDALSAAVDSIESGDGEQLKADELVGRLGALVRDDDPSAVPPPVVAEAPPAGGVRVTLSPDTMMPSVRAFQVLGVIAEHADVRGSVPALDAVEGFTGREIVADAICADPAKLATALREVTDVADVTITDVDPVPEPGPPPSLEGIASAEAQPAPTPDERPARGAQTVRVDAERLDQLLHIMGDLVVRRTALEEVLEDRGDAEANQAMRELQRTSRSLQEMVMRIRMIPIEAVLMRFPRLVRDVAGKLGKEVSLDLVGKDTELDRTVVDAIGDPLVHLVRNSIDHGIEAPDVRVKAGKSPTGIVHLDACHRGGHIAVEIRDDGNGLDKSRILAKARSRGLVGQNDVLTDEQVHELIFMPGFSTAEKTTDVSGRGVGMDVVRRNVKELGGKIEIASELGKGSRFIITLPLTLAIVDGQSVSVGSETYIVPLTSIVESLQLQPQSVNRLSGRGEVFSFRGDYLPIVRLHELFGIEPRATALHEGLIVVAEGDGRRIGLFVDELLGQQQVVIKSMEANYGPVDGVAGATILGDGSVALILDLSGLIRVAAGTARAA